MNLPEPWEIVSLGPANIVDDHELSGTGNTRKLNITLKRELTGSFTLDLVLRASRRAADAPVDFILPAAAKANLHLYTGQVVVSLANSLRAEIAKLKQLQSMPVNRALRTGRRQQRRPVRGLAPVMAFEFRAIDQTKPEPPGVELKIAVKPAQVSAVAHRRVNLQPGSIEHEAVINYKVLYAPVDTFYLKMPATLADTGVQISGPDIKEKPRIEALPADQQPKAPAKAEGKTPKDQPPPVNWAYYRIVLQSPVLGNYWLTVKWRKSFQAGQDGATSIVKVEPVLAAGKLSDQSGHIAVVKAPTLAIETPTVKKLIEGDAGSPVDLPYQAHRRNAIKAFKYNAPPFQLTLAVRMQKESEVFTTIANAVIIEQILARDGTLNARAVFLLSSSRGDRLPLTFPKKTKVYRVRLNGQEVAVETPQPNVRIVRLPHSAGQVAKLVLELTYGLDEASSSRLPAPALHQDVPVQRSFWRLWIPKDHSLLTYDRDFALERGGHSTYDLIRTLGTGHPLVGVQKFATQGQLWSFARQGAATELSVWVVSREWFSIVIWVLVLAAGVAMLKLNGYRRALIVFGVAALAALIHLFAPILVTKTLKTGIIAAVLVLVLWLIHWFFVNKRKRGGLTPPPIPQPAGPTPPPEPAKPEEPEAKPKPKAKAKTGGRAKATDSGKSAEKE